MIRHLLALAILPGCLLVLESRAACQGPQTRTRLVLARDPGQKAPKVVPAFEMRRVGEEDPRSLISKGTLLVDFVGGAPTARQLASALEPFQGLPLGNLRLRGAATLEVGDLAPLRGLSSLQALDLGGCRGLGPEALPFLATIRGLRWLRYEGSGISETDLAQAKGFEQLLTRKVDAWFRKACIARGLVGASLALGWKGRLVYSRGYGWADLERAVPADSASLYRWASISKPLCSVAAVQLAEQGRLDLDADVRSYVQEFPDKGHVITTRQLLGHLGGIVHYRNGKVVRTECDYEVAHPFANLVLSLDHFKESPLIAEPGTRYSYSTHGFILAGAVVRRAGKQSFADQVSERIARALGMATLRPDYQWEDIALRVVGYRRQGVGTLLRSSDTDVSWKLPGGGYISSVEDLGRFGEGLVQGKLVRLDSYAGLWTPQKTKAGKATRYGMGFSVEEWQGRMLVGHGGAQEKTRTQLLLDPGRGHVVAFMTNSEWVKTSPIAHAAMAILE